MVSSKKKVGAGGKPRKFQVLVKTEQGDVLDLQLKAYGVLNALMQAVGWWQTVLAEHAFTQAPAPTKAILNRVFKKDSPKVLANVLRRLKMMRAAHSEVLVDHKRIRPVGILVKNPPKVKPALPSRFRGYVKGITAGFPRG